MRPKPQRQVDIIRDAELLAISEWFPPAASVLELGAGSGYQAAVLSDAGMKVTAVDLASRPPLTVSYHPVVPYDGHTLPFPARSFDVVFTSHVLAHVPHVEALLVEMKRVLRDRGCMIHVVPNPTWRVWTSLLHYPARLRRFARLATRSAAAGGGDTPRPMRQRIRDSIRPAPLGTSPSSLHELARFRVASWRRLFENAGLDVLAIEPTGIFFTGHALAPSMSMAIRRHLSRVFGSVSVAFRVGMR